MNSSKQIILLVSERSGSNLLRSLIGKHKEICAPVPPHLMAEFYNIRKFYGDLRIDENKKKLIENMLTLVNHSYHAWGLNNKDLMKESLQEVNSVVSAFNYLFKHKAKHENKIHYCSKGIHAFQFIDAYRSELDNVKFIHLVRDPRDHVASWKKRPINLLTPYDAIQKWKSEQKMLIDAITTRGLDHISIRYEDLISDTPKTMAKILTYIGVEIDDNCFTTDSQNIESKTNPYWKNLSKPVMKDNKDKFKKELSKDEVELIETISKDEMNFFGYEFMTDCKWQPNETNSIKIEKERLKKQTELSVKASEKMDGLEDKWKLMEILRKELQTNYSKNDFELNIKKSTSLKNRLKHIGIGILGEEVIKYITSKK